jgi:hypothetical protein
MDILDNGDLIFAGRGRDTLLDSFFFTYRTAPDGYHPDGQYVGIQVTYMNGFKLETHFSKI